MKNEISKPKSLAIQTEAFSGPLPHPSDFEKYEAILPGAADRIIKMAEKEQDFRHAIEKQESESFIKLFGRGQIFAFTLAITGILSGALLLAIGKDIGGFTILIASLGSIIGKYLFETKDKDSDRTESKQQTSEKKS